MHTRQNLLYGWYLNSHRDLHPPGFVLTATTPIYSPTQTPTMSSIETPTQPSAGTAGFTIIVAVVAVLVGVGIGLAVARRR